MGKLSNNIMRKFNKNIPKYDNLRSNYNDIKDDEFLDIYKLCKPYTMTSVERMYSLYKAVIYILSNNIIGDFVECGVWRGGSSMIIAQILYNREIKDRKIFLYDTFEGMSRPTENDIDIWDNSADSLLKKDIKNKENSSWCLADITDVLENLKKTNYPPDNIKLIKGKVENTIPDQSPISPIALLRLDTDWYESTKHELIHLYPKLIKNGVIIIDDYGHWKGCRRAVDEYFSENNINILLNRVDYTCRIGIKTQPSE